VIVWSALGWTSSTPPSGAPPIPPEELVSTMPLELEGDPPPAPPWPCGGNETPEELWQAMTLATNAIAANRPLPEGEKGASIREREGPTAVFQARLPRVRQV